jgi:SAM-dependent methyltransferase
VLGVSWVAEGTAASGGETGQGYLLDNAAHQTSGRFSGLDAALDENTKACLSALGIGAGWRCLEVGAGSGSIARWMAELVGARGYVLATDIDTRWTQGDGLSQLEFRQHDVVTDPLAQGEFDVAHARLVLSWLPDRDTVISRLVAALRPGGWLVVEDFDSMLHQCLDPLNDDERAFGKVTDAFRQALHRVADAATAVAWYERLGFIKEWEHRFDPDWPRETRVSHVYPSLNRPVCNGELRCVSKLRRRGEGNDRTDAADLDPRPPVHGLDLGFGDRRREAATGQNSMAGSGNGGRLVARGSRRERQVSGRLLGARLRLAALGVRAQSLPPVPDRD